MRVVSGKARGIPLKAVPGEGTRPILDRVKTALFDTLRPSITDINMLDLFAGSGSVGIEALSQGAAKCVFLDLNPRAISTIRENLEKTKLTELAEVRHTDAFGYLRRTTKNFDLIYVAPPQYKSLWNEAMHLIAERPDVVKPGGLVIVQIDPKEYEKLGLSDFEETEQRKYGTSLIVFFRRSKTSS